MKVRLLIALTLHTTLALVNNADPAMRSSPKVIHAPGSRISVSTELSMKGKQAPEWEEKRQRCRTPCPDPEDDILEDRREALFATLGAVWAATTTAVVVVSAPAAVASSYGTEAKIELPNPYQQMADRASKQCLVETLGNRECLVYADQADKFVYKGADSQMLISRIEKATSALASIPEYVEGKQWSKVTGVLTGPLGELIRTMNQVADVSINSDQAKTKVKLVKTDLYAISDGVTRKDQKMVLKYYEAAAKDLAAFIEVL